MAKKKYEETNIQAIATAIREKTGTEQTYKTRDMADGVNEVYEAGKQAEYDAFWDAYQNNGKRTNYKDAFNGEGWTVDLFKPKYDIKITQSGQRTFMEMKIKVDLRKYLEELGVSLITGSSVARMDDMFGYSAFTALPEIIATDTAQPTLLLQYTFENMPNLVTIDKIILNETGATRFFNTFVGCKALQNITFEGVIGQSVSFASSPLTIESMKSIITHLKNYSGTASEFTYKVTFSSACITALEAEGATSPNGNTWTEYLDDIGWLYS